MWFKKRPDIVFVILWDKILKIVSLMGNKPCIAVDQYWITRRFQIFSFDLFVFW